MLTAWTVLWVGALLILWWHLVRWGLRLLVLAAGAKVAGALVAGLKAKAAGLLEEIRAGAGKEAARE